MLYSEMAQLAEMCLKAADTANPELRVMNTAFSALRMLERASVLANQGGTAGVKALVPAFWGQGLFYYSETENYLGKDNKNGMDGR